MFHGIMVSITDFQMCGGSFCFLLQLETSATLSLSKSSLYANKV